MRLSTLTETQSFGQVCTTNLYIDQLFRSRCDPRPIRGLEEPSFEPPNPYRELFLDVDVEVVSTCDPFSGACNSYASRVLSPGITLQTAQRDNKGHNSVSIPS